MVTATAVREGKGNNIVKEKYMKENLTELVAVRLFKDNDRKRAEYYRDEGWKQSLIVQEGK